MIFVSTLAMMVTATPLPPQVKLTSDDRRTLVMSLRREVGRNFILTGVAKADGTCRSVGSCVTPDDLRAVTATRNATSVDTLIAGANVNGQNPVAIVAVRGVRQL